MRPVVSFLSTQLPLDLLSYSASQLPLSSQLQAFLVALLAGCCHGGLLGAGTGGGSCAAAPFRCIRRIFILGNFFLTVEQKFRSTSLQWPLGCPESAPCCSEFGYCQVGWSVDHSGCYNIIHEDDCLSVFIGVADTQKFVHRPISFLWLYICLYD